MKKVEPIFTKTFEPFFTNGTGWIGFRNLTVDDFTVDIRIPTREELLSSVKRGYGGYAQTFIKLTMTEQTIAMLNEMKWFNRFSRPVDFSELKGEREIKDAIEITDSFNKGFNGKLKTENGGKIRKEEKILEIIDEAMEANQKEFAEKRDEKIQSMIDELINSRISKFVDDYNRQETRHVVAVMTERKKLDEILDTNKDKSGIATVYEVHNSQVERINAEIKSYKDAIAKLQEQKTEVYKNTADTVFEDKLDKVPPSVKEEIEERGRYNNSSNSFLSL